MKNLKMSSGETVQQVKYFPWKREDLSLTPQNLHKKTGHSGTLVNTPVVEMWRMSDFWA